MKTFLWIYAVVGNFYSIKYFAGDEIVVKYAVGPLWLALMAAPVVGTFLVLYPFARRLGFFKE